MVLANLSGEWCFYECDCELVRRTHRYVGHAGAQVGWARRYIEHTGTQVHRVHRYIEYTGT